MTTRDAFLPFWKILNDFAKSNGLPEVLYGEARDWFSEFSSENAHNAARDYFDRCGDAA